MALPLSFLIPYNDFLLNLMEIDETLLQRQFINVFWGGGFLVFAFNLFVCCFCFEIIIFTTLPCHVTVVIKIIKSISNYVSGQDRLWSLTQAYYICHITSVNIQIFVSYIHSFYIVLVFCFRCTCVFLK